MNIKYWFQNRILNDNKNGEWFCAENADVLFYHDFQRDDLKIVGKFPHRFERNSAYWQGIKLGKIIYFPHRYSGEILCFDIESQIFLNSITIKEVDKFMEENTNKLYLGYNSVAYSDGLFLLNRSIPIAIHIKDKCDDYEVIRTDEEILSYWLGANYIVNDNVVYCPVLDSNAILYLDMEKKSMSVINIGVADERFFSLAMSDARNYYTLEGTKGLLYEFDPYKSSISMVATVPDMNCNVHQPITMFFCNKCLYLVPLYDWYGNNIYTWVYDIETHNIYRRASFIDYKTMIRFIAYEEHGMVGYFSVPYGENINFSENVKFMLYNCVEDSFAMKESGRYSLFEEDNVNDVIEDYQYRVKANECISNGVMHLESNTINLSHFINYFKGIC